MSDLNIVVLSGRAAKTPELKTTTGDKEYAFLTLACNEYDFGRKENVTNFVKVTLWAKLAAIVCDKVSKGTQVTVEAKVRIKKGDLSATPKKYDEITLVAQSVVFSVGAPKESQDEAGEEVL